MKNEFKSIIGGLVFLVLLAVAVFSLLARHMAEQTEADVRRIAHVHLKGICELESDRFDAIVHLRFQQIDALLRELARHGAATDHGKALDVVRRFAEFQSTESCTLISASGEMETVYGEPIVRLGDEAFLNESLHAGRRVVTGAWTDAMQVSVYATPARLPMGSGHTSIGLLWCKPISAFKDMLYLNRKDGLVKYRIVRRDSSYLVEQNNVEAPSFFDHLRRHAVPDDGTTAEDAVAKFQQAISANEIFILNSRYVDADMNTNERYCVRAVPLKGSNWYLVSIMSYGAIDKAIEDMGQSRLFATLIAVLILSAGLLSVFFLYMYMTMRQMAALAGAKLATEQALKEAQAAVAKEEAATARAIIAQKEAETAKEYAEQANRTKSEFLSNMSHDIRTPMNAIVGLTTIARAHKDDGTRVEDCLKKITVSGKQLLGLINDVLDMSKIESGKMTLKLENLSLRETMETLCDIVRPQIESNGQNFDVYVSRILSEQVFCDGVRLNQVMLNFLSNAMKFTPSGGSIDVELWQEPSSRGEGWVRTHFAVKDTGMGMTEEYQKKLFTAFEREDSRRVHRTQGTGLGLTITKYIVDAMDGTIEVDSAPGKGTRFHVIVDFERVPSGSDELSLPPWSVLVVDDSKDMCSSAAEILMELGARPHTCTSGAAAVEMASRAHAAGEDFFAAIIDYKMPVMNGIETAVKMREATDGKVPEILVSAYDWNDIEEEAKAAGISGFVPKPLFKSTLHRALTRLAGGGGEDAEGRRAEESLPTLEGMRVLLAEDQPINAEIATTSLEEAGASVSHAEDGLVARKLFADSEPGFFDVILMDLRMPHMDGFGATAAIREMNRADARTVPIIALTADAFAEDAQRCIDAGMNAHLSKPLDAALLIKMLAGISEENHAKA
ncbi:MAG: response regulator [Desulfovibrio sp.]|nr:response regulator [Desulfovibrio sp.]